VRDSLNASFETEVVRFLLKFFCIICSLSFSFVCLHHQGRLYDSHSTNETFVPTKKYHKRVYYVEGADKWNTSASLDFGEFFVYNMLVLLVLPPSSSIITQICVTFGSIISIQVGCFLTDWLCYLVGNFSAPRIPIPVIMVSLHIWILNIIIPKEFDQCIEL
jgi:hypothetical protein